MYIYIYVYIYIYIYVYTHIGIPLVVCLHVSTGGTKSSRGVCKCAAFTVQAHAVTHRVQPFRP